MAGRGAAVRDRRAAARTCRARAVPGVRVTMRMTSQPPAEAARWPAVSTRACRTWLRRRIVAVFHADHARHHETHPGRCQENTVLTCEDSLWLHGDDVLLVTGPPLGPEGSLLERVEHSGVRVEILPSLRARFIRCATREVISRSNRAVRAGFSPRSFTRTAARRACWDARPGTRPACRRSCTRYTVRRFIRIRAGARGRFFALRALCGRGACDALVSVADAMTDLMVEAGVAPREKFTTVYSGMEVEPSLQANEQCAATRRELGYDDTHVVVGKIALVPSQGTRRRRAGRRAVIAANPRAGFCSSAMDCWPIRFGRPC